MPLKAADVGGLEVTNVVDGVGGVIGFTRSLNKMYKEQFEKSVQELMAYENERKRGKIGCIIYDVFMYFAQSVADQFMIPGICLRTSCAASILGITATHTPQERGFNMPVHVPIESLVQVPELKALELGKVAEHLNELNAAVATAFNKSIAIIVNTMGFLEWAAINKAQEYFKATVYPIGPFHLYAENTNKSNSLLNEDPTCIAWLNQHPPRSVLYVSFGSLASMSEKDLLETATGLVQSNQPFLWVIRPKMVIGGRCWAEILPRDLIERIEETGLVVSWAPQRQVLGHGSIGGFWTHCGWNSTIEGVCEGVPMIWMQIENEIERKNVKRIVRDLMVDEKGKEMRIGVEGRNRVVFQGWMKP
uniref:Uncharacterized protein n=1 Tax=Chenopodium quinoa TaxID=63459 RepID=A0A803LX57_CHEQI